MSNKERHIVSRYRLAASAIAAVLLFGAGPALAAEAPTPSPKPFKTSVVADFDQPWAMTFLPDGRLLVTEKRGRLRLFDPATGQAGTIEGVPEVAYGGQGGLGDIILHPDFSSNNRVYLSYAEPGSGRERGGAVATARLVLADNDGRLEGIKVIWRQTPKYAGKGHFGHRLAFDRKGMLWITSSERQEFDPAQAMTSNLGKMIRLRDDGSIPDDNPFHEQGGVAAQVWSLGHRNLLGLAFDGDGQLWAHEMGPRGGDELNLIERGANYGYPLASNGVHYSGKRFPSNHADAPQFHPPAITWTPVISPAGFIIYDGDLFPAWQRAGLIGGLSSEALVQIAFDGKSAREAARYDMQARIREVEQGPDGAVWLLEDEAGGSQGRLLKLTPP